ncbi:TonB-dependent receptor [Phenylobacterium montanum]|uniref:TonB-dependent receptor n=1 Tax=Phenylobacterium montanum TaxID=2823693 RepID=A0A975G448_9CAUL|nr:TonB-dependent receptor [Caulobacter sp. S6]QUD90520.1 TonB-dependent receptor [Caulobacter sp. S6]
MGSFKRGSAQRSVLASLGVFGMAALFGAPAQAQTASPATAAPAADAVAQVETVIVTARRRSESVETTPVAVTAIAPSVLKNAAAPDVRDLAGHAPGLVIDQVNAGPSAAAISIRGISFEDIEKSFDPAVGVLIDDVYIGTNTGQLTDAFDLQAVEVLRGPQGSLFGRNTIGGVVKVERTRPTGVFGGSIDTIQGDYGRQEYHAVLNLPQIGDQLSTKLFFSSRQSDGYERNVTLNQRTPASDIKRYGVDFLWKPTQNFDINLTLEHERERSKVDQASLSTSSDLICASLPLGPEGSLIYLGPPFQPPQSECNRNNKNDLYTTFSNKVGEVNNDEDDVTVQANWHIGRATLTSVTGYRTNKEHVAQDFDATSVNFFDTVRDQKYHQFSEELRLSGDFGKRLTYVGGLYYFDSHYDLNQLTNYGLLLQTAAGLPAQGQQLVGHDSKSYAAFGDVNWEFLPKWRLDVGGRYTRDDKNLHNDFVGAFNVDAGKSWGEFTPKASIDYRPTDDIMAYFSYSRGYRSGGFNGRASTIYSSTTPYNPETVDAFELGAKTQWFDRRLVANIALFDTEYHNKQEEVVVKTPPGSPDPQETLVANAASAKIRGVEIEVQATPVRHLEIHGGLGLLDGKYSNFYQADATYTTLRDDLSNLTLRRAPKTTANLGFSYKIPSAVGDWTVAADYHYIAKHQTAIVAAPGTGVWSGAGCATGTQPCTFTPALSDPRSLAQASNIIDASLNWDHPLAAGTVRVSVFGRNLLDDRGLAGALPVAGLFTFGTPRPPLTWGVQLGYRF